LKGNIEVAEIICRSTLNQNSFAANTVLMNLQAYSCRSTHRTDSIDSLDHRQLCEQLSQNSYFVIQIKVLKSENQVSIQQIHHEDKTLPKSPVIQCLCPRDHNAEHQPPFRTHQTLSISTLINLSSEMP
jgi:hypothetical protein